MTYEEALAYIASLAPRGWRLGLDRMQELLRRCDLEDFLGAGGKPKYIHVAGTNGKGSVTAYLQSLLVEQGYRTGAFFSPFVYTPRERVQFGREMISEVDLAAFTSKLMPLAETLSSTEFGGATEFEFKTALGFAYWKQHQCDWIALEVGLGGRLDATNVVTPAATIIVSIGLDHVNILGHSLAEIAFEKAGIIKPGVPVILGELPHEAEQVILGVAAENNAPVWRFGHEIGLVETSEGFRVQTPVASYSGLQSGLIGAKQAHNMALAVAAIDASGAILDSSKVVAGALKAAIPGRMERKIVDGTEVVLDGAHNPDAALVLRENLDRYHPGRRIHMVVGMVGGHDPAHFFQPILDRVHRFYLVPIDFHRTLQPEELQEALSPICKAGQKTESFPNAEAGFKAAIQGAEEGDFVLVAGSFYLVGEIGSKL
ncbi:MAG TPA: folylpolyglutamate synthase/dihydrofolate synthase family protein [Fimbriimonadaceae bacterium]|jgi:dihydrofolate synthase/folylpolyglutamate synthase